MSWQAKIDLTTGDLLAFGYTDFTSDGSFDAASQVVVVSYQEGLIPKNRRRITPHHRWDGTAWTLIELDLTQVKMNKIAALANETASRLRSSYPVDRLDSLDFILNDAVERGLLNRATHIRTKNAWGMGILQFYVDQKATIEALTTIADVDWYTWNFTSIMEVDPMVTVPSALAIGD